MVDTTSKWEDELGRWLKPFLDRLGHKARRRMCNASHTSATAKPWPRKANSRSDEQLRFWLSAMLGSRCMTRFANTKLSLAKKMLLQLIRGPLRVDCVRG